MINSSLSDGVVVDTILSSIAAVERTGMKGFISFLILSCAAARFTEARKHPTVPLPRNMVLERIKSRSCLATAA
jgi:hypothetical protein